MADQVAETILIRDLRVEVQRSPRRKTIELVVERDAEVRLLAPETATRERLEQILNEKLVWIYGKLGRKEEELQRPPKKEFVSGEGFHYLGKKHRLKVLNKLESQRLQKPLSLYQGRFLLRQDALPKAREHFVRWYSQHGSMWVMERLQDLSARVGATPSSFEIRDLSYRWGSCTEQGKVMLHWKAILLPPSVIRYLLLHELVHLIEHNHSPEFYRRMRAAVSDYERVEEWLRLNGDEFGL